MHGCFLIIKLLCVWGSVHTHTICACPSMVRLMLIQWPTSLKCFAKSIRSTYCTSNCLQGLDGFFRSKPPARILCNTVNEVFSFFIDYFHKTTLLWYQQWLFSSFLFLFPAFWCLYRDFEWRGGNTHLPFRLEFNPK